MARNGANTTLPASRPTQSDAVKSEICYHRREAGRVLELLIGCADCCFKTLGGTMTQTSGGPAFKSAESAESAEPLRKTWPLTYDPESRGP